MRTCNWGSRAWSILVLVCDLACLAGAPSYDRVVEQQGVKVFLDLRPQRLYLDAPPVPADEQDVYPTLEALRLRLKAPFFWRMVSAALLVQKAKAFDDGLLAAVELAAQHGCGHFSSRTNFWVKLAQTLARQYRTDPPDTDVLALLGAACEVGGTPIKLSPGLRREAAAWLQAFLADPVRSKPLGFYTWSDELTRCYRQNKLLQTSLKYVEGGGLADLVAVLRTRPELAASYTSILRLQEKMTNPVRARSSRECVRPRGLGGTGPRETGRPDDDQPPRRA